MTYTKNYPTKFNFDSNMDVYSLFRLLLRSFIGLNLAVGAVLCRANDNLDQYRNAPEILAEWGAGVPAATKASDYTKLGAPASNVTLPAQSSATGVALAAVNPDPGGTGIVYSQYADDASAPEIANLATKLGNDPRRMYEWVRNNIRTEFYYGCSRGAALTLLEQAGNDIDQCALLGALLKAAGYAPSYYLDSIWIPKTATGPNSVGAYDWLGVDNDTGALNILRALDPTAEAAAGAGSVAGFRVSYMWVTVSRSNELLKFVPALKPHFVGRKPRIDLLSGYTLPGALSAAAVGGAGAYSSAPNVSALKNHLSGLSVVASDLIRSSLSLHDMDGAELSRTPVIIPEVVSATASSATNFPAGLSYSASATALTGIPVTYESHFKLGIGAYARWFSLSELAGKLLYVDFFANGTAIVYLDGVEITRESSGDANAYMNVQLVYEYPISFQGGVPLQLPSTNSVLRQNPVAIAYGTGRHLGSLRKLQNSVSEKEAVTHSNAPSSDKLQLILHQYFSQCEELGAMASNSLDSLQVNYFYAGLCYLKNGKATLDARLFVTNQYPRSVNTPAMSSVRGALTLLYGALEGTAIEQMSGSRAFGVPSLFDYAMTQGRSFYLVESLAQLNQLVSNGSLVNFNDTVLGPGGTAGVQSSLANGQKVVLLGNSDVNYSGSSYSGYYGIYSNGVVGTHIKGAWGGTGSSGTGDGSVSREVEKAPTSSTEAPSTHGQTTSKDPVDLSTGAFLKDDVDLVLGGEGEPNGLRLKRSYNSIRRNSDPSGLGRGFTHNYMMMLSARSPVEIDCTRVSYDAAIPILLGVKLAQDIIASESSARAWQVASTSITWAVDQMIKSRASIDYGARSFEFVKRPDGTYKAQDGLAAVLSKLGDGSHLLSFRHGNSVAFRSSDGRFTSVADQFGNSLAATYSGDRLDRVTDSYGRYFAFSYDGTGRLYQISDSTGRQVSYGRDSVGNFLFTDAESKTQLLGINGDYLLTRVVDARNRTVVENEYDAWKRVESQIALGDSGTTSKIWVSPGVGAEVDPEGGAVWTYFDHRGRKIYQVDQLGHVSAWKYDGLDRLTKFISPKGSQTSYSYNTEHVLVSETDPAGNSRTITPDSESRPWRVSDFEGKNTEYIYTAQHRISSITSPGGIVSTFTYDDRGRLRTVHQRSYSTGSVDTYAYDSYGNLDTVTYPDYRLEDYDYNARGDLVQVIDRRGGKTAFEYNKRRQKTKTIQWDGAASYTTQTAYDDAGDVDYVLDASGRKTDYDYDALGKLTGQKKGPATSQITVLSQSYNSRGLLSSSTDALNQSTAFGYDAAHRLTSVTDPLYKKTSYEYDHDGQQTGATTPLGYVTTSVYDSRGFLDASIDADDSRSMSERTVDFSYDKDGRRTGLANRLNNSFSWNYNDVSRTVTSVTPLGRSVVETRNARGLLESVQKASSAVTSYTSYDAEGRLLTRTDGVGTTNYVYWENGLLKQITENGKTSYRDYDNLNRLKEYRDGEGNTLYYSYYPSGELHTLTYPNGSIVTYTYDDFGRLWKVTDWASRVTTYSYDSASRLTRIDRPNGTYRTQEYDAAGQLRYVKEFKSDNSYLVYQELRYDADGRVTYSFLHPKLTTSSLPQDNLLYDVDNQLQTWNGQTVSFDADGNMTSGPLPSGAIGAYGYDARNRLTSAGGSGYRYNPAGLRVEITGNGAASFVVDPNAALSRVLARTKGGSTTYYVYGLGLLYEDTAGSTRTYHYNHQGSTVAITTGGTTVSDRMSYAAFGAVEARTGTSDTPFLLHGELGVMTDSNGLNYMRARYFNSRIMRFVNADPIRFEAGENWYIAFNNNPLIYCDPEGLSGERSDGGVVVQMARFVVTAVRSARDAADAAIAKANEMAPMRNMPIYMPMPVVSGGVFGGGVQMAYANGSVAVVAVVDAEASLASGIAALVMNSTRNSGDGKPAKIKDTPTNSPGKFERVNGVWRNIETGEIFKSNPSAHGGENYNVWKSKQSYDRSPFRRDYSVWADSGGQR